MANAVRVTNEDDLRLQVIDRAQTFLDLVTRAGTMFLGFNAFEKAVPGAGLSGAIVSQIAMKLATADNLVAGAAGVSTLAGMGILNVIDTQSGMTPATDPVSWINNLAAAYWAPWVGLYRAVTPP